jgi:Galactose oxidase, central domain/Kelch motif
MSTRSGADFDFERTINAWLELGPTELSDHVVERARAEVHQTGQRHPMRWPRRFQTMQLSTRFAVAAVIGVLAIGGALYLIKPTQPTVGNQSPTPGVNASPSETARAAAWASTGNMVTPRSGQTATLLADGKVLAAGGNVGDTGLAEAELYDPATRTWTATGSMGTARTGHTATLLPDGRVLVAGGYGGGMVPPSSLLPTSAELYDPASGTWTATGSMGTPRIGGTATLLRDGRVLVAGGISDGTSAELYDPASGTWTATGSMVIPRLGGTATLLRDGRVLVAGGCCDGNGISLASAELYDPTSGTWTATGSMATPRSDGHTATLLTDGRVLVAGGGGGVGSASCCAPNIHGDLPSAELYDPVSGTWTAAGMYVQGGDTATLLRDGRVLVAGGGWVRLAGGGFEAIAELYDPASGSWTRTSNMIGLHLRGDTATLLPDGTVLVVGGSNEMNIEAGAELYDPGSGN